MYALTYRLNTGAIVTFIRAIALAAIIVFAVVATGGIAGGDAVQHADAPHA